MPIQTPLCARALQSIAGSAVIALAALAAMPALAQNADKLARADEGLLKDIAQANIAEIETGKLALEKSQNAEVKKFAQMMIDDHGKALTEVQALAQAKNVKLPDETDVKHKAIALQFKALEGNTFDNQYVKQVGVTDHQNTDKLLKKTQAQAKDADVKALATKMIPVVQMHLQHARTMSTAMAKK